MGEWDRIERHTHGVVKTVDRTAHVVELVPTRQEVDADGEVIVTRGMDLSRYARNPVVLLQHNPEKRIGRMDSLVLTTVAGADALVGRAVLRDADVAAEVADGVLSGVSVGFRSLERGAPMLPGQTGVTHLKTELLEVSLVSLPSCASCVVTAKATTAARADGGRLRLDSATLDQLVHARVGVAVDAAIQKGVRKALCRLTGRVD